MLQLSLSLDRRAADCGGSGRPGAGVLAGRLRSMFGRRPRNPGRDAVGLDDRLLQDMGLSRADLQALSL